MKLERVVDIHFDQSGSYGSGYLIDDQFVLTAKHVAKPADIGTICKVTPLMPIDLAPGEPLVRTSYAACVAWVSAAEDAALLRLEPDRGGLPKLPKARVRLGRIDYASDMLRCRGTGFPNALDRGISSADRRLEGRLAWIVVDQCFSIDVDNAVPAKAELWGGYSGTAIFCGDVLVGMVISYTEAFGGRVLKAVPIIKLLADDGFRNLLNLAGSDVRKLTEPIGAKLTKLGEHIPGLVYWIDREPQVGLIRRKITPLQASPRCRPIVFLIPGQSEDEHRRLIERLCDQPDMRRILGDRETEASKIILPLHWPSVPNFDPVAKFRDLVAELHEMLVLPEPMGEAYDPAALRRRLDELGAPRAFWVRLVELRGGLAHRELLRRWLQLWADVGQRGEGAPVLIFLCLVQDDAPLGFLQRIGRLVAGAPGGLDSLIAETELIQQQLIRVDRLMPIERDHIPDWIRLIQSKCPAVQPWQLDELDLKLAKRMDKPLRMQAF